MLPYNFGGFSKNLPNGIQFVGGKRAISDHSGETAVSLSGLTDGIDTQARNGDFVIAFAGSCYNGSYSSVTTSGYTNIFTVWNMAGLQSFLEAKYKFMSSTPDTEVTFSATPTYFGAPMGGVYSILVFRGVDVATPIDVVAATAYDQYQHEPNPPARTPITGGAKVIFAGSSSDSTNVSGSYACSNADYLIQDMDAQGQAIRMGAGYSNWTSGAFDPALFTGATVNSAINTAWQAGTFVIRPAIPI